MNIKITMNKEKVNVLGRYKCDYKELAVIESVLGIIVHVRS